MKEENNNKRRALGMGLEQLFNSEMLDFDQVEEKIVKEKYKHLSPKEKQQANQRIQKFKNQLLKEKASSKKSKDETNKVS